MENENTKEEIKEVFGQVIGWEHNRIWATVKGLIVRPGTLIKEYCENTQIRLVNPVTYYLFLFAFASYVTSIANVKVEQEKQAKEIVMALAKELNITLSDGSFDITERSNRFLETEIVNSLIFLPIALLLQWIVFKPFNNSFKHNSWFALYTMGQSLIINDLIGTIWWSLTGDTLLLILLQVAAIIYIIWAAKQFYNINLGQATLRTLLFLICGAIVLSLTSFVSGGIFTLIDFFTKK